MASFSCCELPAQQDVVDVNGKLVCSFDDQTVDAAAVDGRVQCQPPAAEVRALQGVPSMDGQAALPVY